MGKIIRFKLILIFSLSGCIALGVTRFVEQGRDPSVAISMAIGLVCGLLLGAFIPAKWFTQGRKQ